MTQPASPHSAGSAPPVRTERTFQRFTRARRWEHGLLLVALTVLLLTGLPQKYRAAAWSQHILATPERVELLRTIHHTAAVLLMLEVVFHLGHAVWLMSRRRLSGAMLPTWQDARDAAGMLRYLLYLSEVKPRFGKYNFEQKFTYWFLFFGLGVLIVSGLILWFPLLFTRFLPGGIIPAAKFAHSTEAIVAGIFVLLWHFYHVHVERLNLSMFTGRLSEEEMRQHHPQEYERLMAEAETEAQAE
jgi:formate dehydrogenase gamma subunit